MGIATIMIIVCHAPKFMTISPSCLNNIIGFLGIGVDIFLILSGLGICHSFVRLNKIGGSVVKWFLQKYIRIILPCAFVIIPVYCYHNDLILAQLPFLLSNLSGFGILWGMGALWFVACILMLYILSPVIHRLLIGPKKWIWFIVFSMVTLSLSALNFGNESFAYYLSFCIQRWPAYFLGYVLHDEIMQDKEVSIMHAFIIPFFFVVTLYMINKVFDINICLFGLQGWIVLVLATLLLSVVQSQRLYNILCFWGRISLESYATNIIIVPIIVGAFQACDENSLSLGLVYFVSTIICLAYSICVNKMCNLILKKK